MTAWASEHEKSSALYSQCGNEGKIFQNFDGGISGGSLTHLTYFLQIYQIVSTKNSFLRFQDYQLHVIEHKFLKGF